MLLGTVLGLGGGAGNSERISKTGRQCVAPVAGAPFFSLWGTADSGWSFPGLVSTNITSASSPTGGTPLGAGCGTSLEASLDWPLSTVGELGQLTFPGAADVEPHSRGPHPGSHRSLHSPPVEGWCPWTSPQLPPQLGEPLPGQSLGPP